MSRDHLIVRWTELGWEIEDQGSTGGTWLLDERVQRCPVVGPVDVHLGEPRTGPLLSLRPELTTVYPTAASSMSADARVTGYFTGSYQPRERTTIGRSLDNDIVVDDLLVSRHHAELRRDPAGQHQIVDLRSRHGTFVNGNRVTAQLLSDGARVGVSHSTFLFTGGTLEEYRTGAQSGSRHTASPSWVRTAGS